MITTLEQFKQAAIELCQKYGLDESFSVGLNQGEYFFRHKEIEEGTPFKGRIPEDILRVAEGYISKAKYSSFF